AHGPALGREDTGGRGADSPGGPGDQRAAGGARVRVIRLRPETGRAVARPRIHAVPSHSRMPAPQVSPAPKAERRTREPRVRSPLDAASVSAIGMLAAGVLPDSARQSMTRSAGRPSRSPTAEMIRELAWWETKRAISSRASPAAETTCCVVSPIAAPAARSGAPPALAA